MVAMIALVCDLFALLVLGVIVVFGVVFRVRVIVLVLVLVSLK